MQIFRSGRTFCQVFNPFCVRLDALLKILNGTPAVDIDSSEDDCIDCMNIVLQLA